MAMLQNGFTSVWDPCGQPRFPRCLRHCARHWRNRLGRDKPRPLCSKSWSL